MLPGRCELYGDPHYISFQGVAFDFMEECTYILVEEQSPRHNLTIAVDNFYCVPGLRGSCAKGIILKYQDKLATLKIHPYLFAVQVKVPFFLFFTGGEVTMPTYTSVLTICQNSSSFLVINVIEVCVKVSKPTSVALISCCPRPH